MELEDRVAIVTGATGGLGQYLVRDLSRHGAAVMVHFRHREQEAASLVQEFGDRGVRAIACRADVADETDVRRVVDMAVGAFGRVDILINNAGVSRNSVSWKMDSDDWYEVLNTNLTGTFFMTKAVLPYMRKAEWGRIINIGSVVAQIGVPGTSAYAASKAGVIGLTRVVAREVASIGITVNCLALGYYEAGMIGTLPPQVLADLVKQVPVQRLGKPDTIAATVRYLCSEEAGFVTGQVINLNGGQFMG